MYEILTSKGTVLLPSRARFPKSDFTDESEAVEMDRLGEGIRIVQEHIEKTRQTLAERELQVEELKKALANR